MRETQFTCLYVGRLSTGKNKLFVNRVYNTDGLTEAKFRKQVEKLSIEFEEDVAKAYQEETTVLRSKELTFSELMKEWQANIKANLSISYYLRAQEVGRKFNAFLVEQHLDDKPISVITVRDVQMFLNSFAQKGYQTIPTVKQSASIWGIAILRLRLKCTATLYPIRKIRHLTR